MKPPKIERKKENDYDYDYSVFSFVVYYHNAKSQYNNLTFLGLTFTQKTDLNSVIFLPTQNIRQN